MIWYLFSAVGLVLAVVWMGWAVADSAYRVFKEINERGRQVSKFIELQGADGTAWVRADKIVVVSAQKFRYMDKSGYREANGSMLLLQLTHSELCVFELPSEVLAKIAEATSASQP